jgi:hypothetical protein
MALNLAGARMRRSTAGIEALLAAACALLVPAALHAQPVQTAGSTMLVYPRDYFAPFNPADAYDMVRRVPGFTIIDGNPDVRGFAGALGNVLFDGKPLSSKQESLEEQLKRIAAANVERIELVRGAAAGIDMGGHPVIVNVVRRAAATARGSITGGLVTASDAVPFPLASIEVSRTTGKRRIQGSLELTTEVDEDSGDGDIRVMSPEGGIVERSRRTNWEVAHTRAASIDYATPLSGGDLAVNGSYRRELTDIDTNTFPEAAADDPQFVDEREKLTSLEAGARYGLAVGNGLRLDAFAIQRLGRLRSAEAASEGDDRDRFDEATDTSETIGRLALKRERDTLTLEASAEGALNRLTSHASLTENGALVPLPGSDADVEELRGEASVGATWKPRKRLVVESSLRAERSTIESHGPFGQRNSFLFWKPRIAASYAVGKSDQVRVHFQRDVGQLDFGDFVASASLERGDISAGAPSLTPPQTWSASLAYEHRFWGDGALVVTLEHQRIDDVIDRTVLIVDGQPFDVVGNIGKGKRLLATVELSAPLDRLGLKHMQLTSTVTWLRSRATDPITGARRGISEDKPVEGEVRISQDLFGGKLNWGAEIELAERKREYRFDELRAKHEQFRLGAHIEYRPSDAWRIRLEGSNLNGRAIVETRDEYDGLRSLVPLQDIERRSTRTTPTVRFTIRRSF